MTRQSLVNWIMVAISGGALVALYFFARWNRLL